MNKIIHGNCLEKLKTIKENSVDSIVTDPPYELGFMGKSWDNSGIAYNIEMWRECFRVLKPGGHLLSFGGTRTYHRMATAIEDAGFEIRDMIEWAYGSGFPKSLAIGKAIDKLQGNERETIGEKVRGDVQKAKEKGVGYLADVANRNNIKQFGYGIETITKGSSEWEGWGTALKPAHEPICMARKPLSEKTVAENVLKYGTGGINIDESRVEYSGKTDPRTFGGKWKTDKCAKNVYEGGYVGSDQKVSSQGRFPANLIHDNSEEVRECFPETKSGKDCFRKNPHQTNAMAGTLNTLETEEISYGDQGNASRFFKSIIYTAKASKSERNKGCESLEEKLAPTMEMRKTAQPRISDNPNYNIGTIIEPPKKQNNHPTVKPIALMEYLIKMITPKGGIVLDPFAGSGTTLVAAKKNGFQYIGIEMIEEYIPIIQYRVDAVKDETKIFDFVNKLFNT